MLAAASARKNLDEFRRIHRDRTCIFVHCSYDTLLNRIAFAGVIESEVDQVTVSASGSRAPVGLGPSEVCIRDRWSRARIAGTGMNSDKEPGGCVGPYLKWRPLSL